MVAGRRNRPIANPRLPPPCSLRIPRCKRSGHKVGLCASDRATLLVMLFVETGCLGDLRQAASGVEAASEKIMGVSFRTVQGVAADFTSFDLQVEEVNLALAVWWAPR